MSACNHNTLESCLRADECAECLREGAKAHSLQRVVRRVCPTCEEQRVPQYDVELKCAEAAVHEWMQIAKRLHSVMGLRKTELRRIAAENEYDHALKDYGAWRLEAPKAPNDQALRLADASQSATKKETP